MFKLLSIIFLIKVMAAGMVKAQTLTPYQNVYNHSEYLYVNDQNNYQKIHDYDVQIEMFRKSYIAQVNTMNTTLDFLVSTIVQTQDNLNILKLFNELSKSCVNKYHHFLPSVSQIQQEMNICIETALNQVESLLETPLLYRNNLNSYYINTFDNDISRCKKRSSNVTECILDVVANSNNYTYENQKSFNMAMDAAECSGKINLKKAFNCSFTVENRAFPLNFKTNSLVNNCLHNNYCMPNNTQCYSCGDIYYMTHIDYYASTIVNPFRGTNAGKSCLLLKV